MRHAADTDTRPAAHGGAYAAAGATRGQVRATLAYLRARIAARAAGAPLAFADDPAWLLDMAINRRAGWPDDPSHFRGSARPLPSGQYPRKAQGLEYGHLARIARDVNRPRLRVHASALGEWRALLLSRLPGRFALPGED